MGQVTGAATHVLPGSTQKDPAPSASSRRPSHGTLLPLPARCPAPSALEHAPSALESAAPYRRQLWAYLPGRLYCFLSPRGQVSACGRWDHFACALLTVGAPFQVSADGQWVHIACALFIPEVRFEDPDRLFTRSVTSPLLPISRLSPSLPCLPLPSPPLLLPSSSIICLSPSPFLSPLLPWWSKMGAFGQGSTCACGKSEGMCSGRGLVH